MTKLKNGILGPISGKLGPVVGASWKGIAYLRTAPKKGKKKKQRSPAQLASQHKFKFLNEFLIPFHPYLTNGFKHKANQKTEINAAFTANYPSVLGVYPGLEINYQSFVISEGNLAPLAQPILSWLNSQQLELNWSNQHEINSNFDDQLMLVLYCPVLKKADGFVGGVKRIVKNFVCTIDEKFEGHDLEAYVCLISLNGKAVSNSTYLGRMVAL